MDQIRVIDAMQQKTVANGCTPGEAAAAAAWVATHRRAHLKVVVGAPVAAPVDVSRMPFADRVKFYERDFAAARQRQAVPPTGWKAAFTLWG